MKVDLITENDLFKWVVTINGPKDTPYAVSSCTLARPQRQIFVTATTTANTGVNVAATWHRAASS